MKKSILFLYKGSCFQLPPFLTIIDSLIDEYHLSVISFEKITDKAVLKEMYKGKDISFLEICSLEQTRTFTERVKNRLKFHSNFHKHAVALLEKTRYDILWVIHENTLFEFRDALKGKKYIASIYELNDHRQDFLQKIKDVVNNAQTVIVPEYNRACILRTWLKLNKTPLVLPNKPLLHPKKRNIECEYSTIFRDKKIILYQGVITRSRNLDKICEAVATLNGYTLVLMGGKTDYRDYLQRTYPNVLCIDFVNPPAHLNVTSYAYIAIVKYDYVYLNALFCAPNKTWEYSGFGIPILANDIPGLEYTIGKYNAGICTNMDNVEDIKSSIIKISDNYEFYSNNALVYYNSFDVKSFIHNVVDKF